MSYTHHKLEYIPTDYLREFKHIMAPLWLNGSHIFTTCFEPDVFNDSNIDKYIAFFKTKPKQAKAVLLVMEDTQNKYIHMLNEYIPTLVFNQLVWETCKTLPEVTEWDMNADKFVCLTGAPTKFNRYRLIVEMAKRNLLEHCEYSLQLTPDNLAKSVQHLELEDQKDYNNFNLNSNPDNSVWYEVEESGNSWHPHIMKTDILEHKRFRLISETGFDQSNHKHKIITEKTWYTIGYKLPFIIAGQYGTCKYLNELGFHTFDEYLIKPYDLIHDSKERMDAVLENVEHWKDNVYPDMYDKVQENYNIMIQMGKEQDSLFKNIFKDILDIPYDDTLLSQSTLNTLKENRKKLD